MVDGLGIPRWVQPLRSEYMTVQFEKVESGLWQWRDWFIACAYGRFWLLTPTPREFGPFVDFDEAMNTVNKLVW
jgi:hypothetical protein